jgi:hypothetical protein
MATKTTTVTFRMDPAVKELLRVAASREHRSIANMIEWMILRYAETNGVGVSPARRKKVIGKPSRNL